MSLSGKEDREEMKREIRCSKNESLENCFTPSRATEEKLLQMAERVETTDKEREKFVHKDTEEVKKRYETVNDKSWSLDMRMYTMSRDQAGSFYSIQSKLGALLRNSINQDKAAAKKTVKQPGTMVEFAEMHRKKQESTPLPQVFNIVGLETGNSATKGSASKSTGVPKDSNTHAITVEDAMT